MDQKFFCKARVVLVLQLLIFVVAILCCEAVVLAVLLSPVVVNGELSTLIAIGVGLTTIATFLGMFAVASNYCELSFSLSGGIAALCGGLSLSWVLYMLGVEGPIRIGAGFAVVNITVVLLGILIPF